MKTAMTRIALLAGLATASTASAAPAFGTPGTLATAQRPGGVASADFNGDGLADLAVTADNIDRIDVFFGTGGGAFGPATPIFTGANSGPDALVSADVNGDGQADLVVVLKNQNTVRVYTNNGGAFAAGSSAGTGAEPVSLRSADLDGDGDADFVVANRDGNSFSVLTNTGGALASASFGAGLEPRDAAPIDINGDGQMEVAVSNHDARNITIHASGTYAVQQTLAVNPITRPEGLAVADLDGDGDSDLAAALSDDAISFAGLYMNNGASLGAAVNVVTNGADTGGIIAADFDLDGDIDLVTANQDSNNVSVIENAAGVFQVGAVMPVGTRPEAMFSADLDNNGSPDFAVTNRDSNNTMVFLSDAVGAPQPCNAADLAEAFGVLDLADVQAFVAGFTAQNPVADIDGNGVFDLADIQAFVLAFTTGCPA